MLPLSPYYLFLLTFTVFLTAVQTDAIAHQGRQGDAASRVKETVVPLREEPAEYSVVDVRNGGSVYGVVRLLSDTGVSTVKDAVVYIRGIQRGKAFSELLKRVPVIDQRDHVFIPHVTVVPVGHEVELRNADPELHNLHSYSVKNASFNEGIPSEGRPIRKRFDFVEVIRLGCDIHKEMAAWIVVRDNPYYCLTGKDGVFEITDVPPGAYELAVWHEDFDREELAALRTEVEVEANRRSEVDFYLSHRR